MFHSGDDLSKRLWEVASTSPDANFLWICGEKILQRKRGEIISHWADNCPCRCKSYHIHHFYCVLQYIYRHMEKSIKIKKIIKEIQDDQYILRQKKLLKIAKQITIEFEDIVKKEFGV
jgi:hypothetical protein